MELTLHGMLSAPFEPKGNTGGKSVYHVSERVFRMSPVYTRSALAPGYHISRLWRLPWLSYLAPLALRRDLIDHA